MTKSCYLKGHHKLFFLELDQVASCCKAHPTNINTNAHLNECFEHWDNEKQLLNQGVEIPGCEYCWRDERAGVTSFRQRLQEPGPEILEFFMSNLCNQMCSYCSPKFSSEWNNSILSAGTFSLISRSANDNLAPLTVASNNKEKWLDQIKHYVNSRHNQVIVRFLGGEPLMQLNTLKFFQELDYSKISSIEINTNLNPPTNKFLVWAVETIPKEKLKMTVSLDATPEYNHIPRGLFNRQVFLENLKLLQSHKIDFKIASVISVLSIFDLPNFVKWLETHNVKFQRIILNNPECLSVNYVPLDMRKEIWNSIRNSNYASHFEHQLLLPESKVDLKLFEQYNYLNQYFQRINQDPTSINNQLFHEYWKWLLQKVKNETSHSQ